MGWCCDELSTRVPGINLHCIWKSKEHILNDWIIHENKLNKSVCDVYGGWRYLLCRSIIHPHVAQER